MRACSSWSALPAAWSSTRSCTCFSSCSASPSSRCPAGDAGGGAGRGARPRLTTRPRQVYYSLWRKLLKLFWWLVVAYTMLVLIAVYTFQFQDFPSYWRNLTGLTDEQ